MHSNDKYCHDVASLSIADICALIDYNEKIIENQIKDHYYPNFRQIERNLAELKEYMYEYNLRLSNRTLNFDPDYSNKNPL